MTTSLERAVSWRKRAQECRTIAALVKTPRINSSYLGIAQSYETLADNAEADARKVCPAPVRQSRLNA
jgi:hypothetical protein